MVGYCCATTRMIDSGSNMSGTAESGVPLATMAAVDTGGELVLPAWLLYVRQ